jgi:hypothetical protein
LVEQLLATGSFFIQFPLPVGKISSTGLGLTGIQGFGEPTTGSTFDWAAPLFVCPASASIKAELFRVRSGRSRELSLKK